MSASLSHQDRIVVLLIANMAATNNMDNALRGAARARNQAEELAFEVAVLAEMTVEHRTVFTRTAGAAAAKYVRRYQ